MSVVSAEGSSTPIKAQQRMQGRFHRSCRSDIQFRSMEGKDNQVIRHRFKQLALDSVSLLFVTWTTNMTLQSGLDWHERCCANHETFAGKRLIAALKDASFFTPSPRRRAWLPVSIIPFCPRLIASPKGPFHCLTYDPDRLFHRL